MLIAFMRLNLLSFNVHVINVSIGTLKQAFKSYNETYYNSDGTAKAEVTDQQVQK